MTISLISAGQSLLAAELMSEVEKKFQRKLNLSRLVAAPTIEGFGVRPYAIRLALRIPMSFRLRVSGTRAPLICIHCGTGHVFRYRAMTSYLSEDQPVYGLRAPDVAGMAKLPTVEELGAIYLQEIRSHQPKGPYQICGLSFGGVVAFEVASRLRALGEEKYHCWRFSILATLLTTATFPSDRWIRVRSTYLFDPAAEVCAASSAR